MAKLVKYWVYFCFWPSKLFTSTYGWCSYVLNFALSQADSGSLILSKYVNFHTFALNLQSGMSGVFSSSWGNFICWRRFSFVQVVNSARNFTPLNLNLSFPPHHRSSHHGRTKGTQQILSTGFRYVYAYTVFTSVLINTIDPSKIKRTKRAKDFQEKVRLMTPFSMRCDTCGEFIYKGKKYNARKEKVKR